MKKKVATYLLITLVITLVFSIVLFARNYTKPSLPSYRSETPEKIGYILREYNGKIGVFTESGEEPISVINFDIRTLPETERVALAIGIRISTEEALNEKLEDYSS